MANYILLLCLVCPPSVFALQCYENEAITATNCLERENDVAAGIADVCIAKENVKHVSHLSDPHSKKIVVRKHKGG